MVREAAGAVSARLKPVGDDGTGRRCAWYWQQKPSPSSSDHSTVQWIAHSDCASASQTGGSTGSTASSRIFPFDRVFDERSSTSDIFNHSVKRSVDDAIRGLHAAILTFGQTGAGKTHTMGTSASTNVAASPFSSSSSPPNPSQIDQTTTITDESDGLVQMAITHLFEHRDTQAVTPMRLSALEVYSDQLRDLLDESTAPVLRSAGGKSFEIDGLTSTEIYTEKDARSLVQTACESRSTGSTRMNSASSRSHLMITINVPTSATSKGSGNGTSTTTTYCKGTATSNHPSKSSNGSAETVAAAAPAGYGYGSLVCVDLAGSEKQRATGTTGKELNEACGINKSLSALAGVVSSLSEGKTSCVPFRDSKLTKTLQSSLHGALGDGSARVQLIVCINPRPSAAAETLSSLRFAAMAKRASSKCVAMEPSSPSKSPSPSISSASSSDTAQMGSSLQVTARASQETPPAVSPNTNVDTEVSPNSVSRQAHVKSNTFCSSRFSPMSAEMIAEAISSAIAIATSYFIALNLPRSAPI